RDGSRARASTGSPADPPPLRGGEELGLKNPLREICTAGSVRGENPVSHGELKRARSWKRRTQPKNTYSTPGTPLLGKLTSKQDRLAIDRSELRMKPWPG